MQFCSTRGGVYGWDFRDVLFSGYAPDGGMFMPENVPVLSPDTLWCWRGLPYTKLVVEVASLFIPSQLIPRQDLEGELKKSKKQGKYILCLLVTLIKAFASLICDFTFYKSLLSHGHTDVNLKLQSQTKILVSAECLSCWAADGVALLCLALSTVALPFVMKQLKRM